MKVIADSHGFDSLGPGRPLKNLKVGHQNETEKIKVDLETIKQQQG